MYYELNLKNAMSEEIDRSGDESVAMITLIVSGKRAEIGKLHRELALIEYNGQKSIGLNL